MYNIDPKFFNADGSLNTETAQRAGRVSQALESRAAMTELWVLLKKMAGFIVEYVTVPATQSR